MTTIDDLLAKGLIEPVDADTAMSRQWLEDARRHLQAAEAIADIDPSGAYVLAYDAARKSVAAALLATGHRVRSRPGSPSSDRPVRQGTRQADRRTDTRSLGPAAPRPEPI